jgi:hypothetical protein
VVVGSSPTGLTNEIKHLDESGQFEKIDGSPRRALTIWQPWASLIMIGAKPYEFRGRSYLAYINHPQPGERIAIHVGARPVRRAEEARLCSDHDTTGLVREQCAHAILLYAKVLCIRANLRR